MKKICVIGSLNIDVSVGLSELPRSGETVLADSFALFAGGKGANQAVAAGRLGADVRMVGLLGSLFQGGDYLRVLEENHVKHDTVDVLKGQYPGIASITVDSHGANTICVYSGANNLVTPQYIDRCWDKISGCDIFLLQQEIPAETNLHIMRKLNDLPNKLIILDPAPAGGFVPECLPLCDVITPNEVELALISGIEPKDEGRCRKACERLHDMGAKAVIGKAGGYGAYMSDGKCFEHIPAFDVHAADTTAAGDTFNAGLAFALSLGLDLRQSITLGHAAAAISTTKPGAQSAMPDMEKLLRFLNKCAPSFAQVLATLIY